MRWKQGKLSQPTTIRMYVNWLSCENNFLVVYKIATTKREIAPSAIMCDWM